MIERKSLPDYLSSITNGKERFQREMERLKSYRWRWIVVEADFSDIVTGAYQSCVNPNAAIGLTAAYSVRHAPVFFASNHAHAGIIVERLLLMCWKQIQDERAAGGK